MRVTTVKVPFRLGLDGFGREVGASSDGYPPYNLERLPRMCGGPERLRLVFAVAGFAPDQLDVSVTDRHLVVRGEQKNDGDARQFLHRGIAARRFQRTFVLADGLDVTAADLADGILTIDLSCRDICTGTTTINITARDR